MPQATIPDSEDAVSELSIRALYSFLAELNNYLFLIPQTQRRNYKYMHFRFRRFTAKSIAVLMQHPATPEFTDAASEL